MTSTGWSAWTPRSTVRTSTPPTPAGSSNPPATPGRHAQPAPRRAQGAESSYNNPWGRATRSRDRALPRGPVDQDPPARRRQRQTAGHRAHTRPGRRFHDAATAAGPAGGPTDRPGTATHPPDRGDRRQGLLLPRHQGHAPRPLVFWAVIPQPSEIIAHRARRGSNGGRPPAFDPVIYKGRNVIERSFNDHKQWRGIATRYDKLAATYRGGVVLRAITIWLNPLGNTPSPPGASPAHRHRRRPTARRR